MFKTPFKPIGHYVFNYKPRYYDEKKERLQALEEKYHSNKDDIKFTKNNLVKQWQVSKQYANTSSASYYIRLGTIVIVLSTAAWLFLNLEKVYHSFNVLSKFIDQLIQS